MNKEQFLKALQRGLADVPAEERVAAVQYYTEYLDDAGPEREAEVLQELGDPQKIVAEICADSEKDGWTPPARTYEARVVEASPAAPELAAPGAAPAAPPPPDGMWGGSYPVIPEGGGSEAGRQPPLPPGYLPAQQEPPPAAGPAQEERPHAESQAGPLHAREEKPRRTGGQIVLLILAIIFLWPFIIVFIAVVFVLLVTVIVLMVTLVIILAVPVIVGVGLVAGSLAGFVLGGLIMSAVPASGLVMIGASLLLLGLGLLCTWGGAVLLKKTVPPIIGKGVPALFKGFFRFVQRIFRHV